MCSHVIFIFFLEIAGGDGINQFLMKIWVFWCIIWVCSCSEQEGHQFFVGGSSANWRIGSQSVRVTEAKNVSVFVYKNLKLSFSTWLTHLTLRFLNILGCSGPWWSMDQISCANSIAYLVARHGDAGVHHFDVGHSSLVQWSIVRKQFVEKLVSSTGLKEQAKGISKVDWEAWS